MSDDKTDGPTPEQLDAAMDEWIAREPPADWVPPKLEEALSPFVEARSDEVVAPEIRVLRPPAGPVPRPPPPTPEPRRSRSWLRNVLYALYALMLIAVSAFTVYAILRLASIADEIADERAAWRRSCAGECLQWYRACVLTKDPEQCAEIGGEIFPQK